jgi:lysophospholipase L1-like esterase
MSKRICVFGSSIGHGRNDSECGGWCDRLKRYYFNEGCGTSVYNLSISGDISSDVVKRFAVEYNARQPKIVLIAIGMNDSTFDDNLKKSRASLKDMQKNIEYLISTIKTNGSKVAVIGLTYVDEKRTMPVPWALNLLYSNDNVKKYDKILEKVSNDNNIPYCYMYDLLRDEDLDDGLHPNAEGHKKMYEKIKNFLIENKL